MSKIAKVLGLAFAAVTFVSVAQAQSSPKAAVGRNAARSAQTPDRGVVLEQKRATAASSRRRESANVKGRVIAAERRTSPVRSAAPRGRR